MKSSRSAFRPSRSILDCADVEDKVEDFIVFGQDVEGTEELEISYLLTAAQSENIAGSLEPQSMFGLCVPEDGRERPKTVSARHRERNRAES